MKAAFCTSFILLVLSLSACSQQPATVLEAAAPKCTLTVAKSGGDYTRLQDAANIVKPGDVVCVRAGTYKEYVSFKRSGTASQRITFMVYPGE